VLIAIFFIITNKNEFFLKFYIKYFNALKILKIDIGGIFW